LKGSKKMKKWLALMAMVCVLGLVAWFLTSCGGAEPGKSTIFLNITQPEDESIVDTPQIVVSGVTEPAAVVSISGNSGEPVLAEVDAEGKFSIIVTLQEGLNSIEVVVSNSEGNQNSQILTITYTPA
jgi:hypothetical protein